MILNIRNIALALLLVLLVSASVILWRAPVIETGAIVHSEDLSPGELVARGEYLVTAGNCASCHTTQDGAFMSGGLPFRTPFGTIYSTNITPDPLTGIGNWSEVDFLNSLRHGVRPDGDHLYPAFPYTAYTKASDDDILAMFAYLKSIKPVRITPPQNDLVFPFNYRPLMAFWKLLYFQPGVYEVREDQSEQWNRGAYLVEALAHCSACHSPRNSLGAERAAAHMGGGEFLDLVAREHYRPWSAPNLTATERGLALWSEQDLADYLKTARNDMLESFGPMNEVIINSTRYLEAQDIGAMVTYLKNLPAVPEREATTPGPAIMGRGRTIYNLHCGTCHLPTGEGDPDMAPRLDRGSLVVQDENPASMINAILYGPHLPSPPLQPKWREPMEDFQYLLDDEEVAAAATFIRHSWGNASGMVTADQVARQR
ncbi:MAG: cytochrome c [Pseudohongiellaceae bacterium]